VDNEAFKEKLAAQAFKLKTAYCECPTYDVVVPALLEVCPITLFRFVFLSGFKAGLLLLFWIRIGKMDQDPMAKILLLWMA
jgi:hypothetical protein